MSFIIVYGTITCHLDVSFYTIIGVRYEIMLYNFNFIQYVVMVTILIFLTFIIVYDAITCHLDVAFNITIAGKFDIM